MSYRLGVDLGTTFTAAAVANGTPATMVGLGNRALQIPSVLFLTAEGDFLVGEAAERRGLAQPDRLVREFKRRIGDSVPMLVAGTPYSPQTLTARLLRHVCSTAAERMGSEPEQVVLTHPANWGPFKLELLDQVAVLADVGPVVRCPEPLAAAAQYAVQNRVDVGATIAVYDLGGGTFDACVLRKTDSGFDLLGTPEGIEHLGGIDFDEALFQHAVAVLGDRLSGLDVEDPETVLGLTRLRRDCVEAKEALSSDTEALVAVSLPGMSTTLRLNRTEFEGLIRPALRETVDAMARTLRSADAQPADVAAIVLVGGSSRIPLVGELLQQAFGRPTALDTHPKHDVALGAVQTITSTSLSAPPQSAVSTLRPPEVTTPRSPATPAPAGSPPSPTTPAVEPGASPATPVAESRAVREPAPVPAALPPRVEPPGARDVPADTPVGGRRRPARAIVAAVAGGAVLAGVLTGVALMNRDAPATDGGAGTSLDPSTPIQSGSQLPASDPLPVGQLIVPVNIGANWDLWLADDTETAPVTRLTSDPAPDTTPALSPDRRTVIYTHDLNTDGKRTLLVKAAGTPGDGRPLFDPLPEQCRGTIGRPAWNPVRPDELAVPCIDEAGTAGLYRFTTGGQLISTVELPAGTGRLDDPAYSPDGTQLSFWAAPMSTWEGGTIYTEPVAGGTPKVLLPTTTRGEDADGVWSPDGKYIAFRRRLPDNTTGGNFEIFRVTTDGSKKVEQLTHDAADQQDPTYSPDGKYIAYKSAQTDPKRPVNDVQRIWVMDADGKNPRPLWSGGSDSDQTAAAWGRR